VSKEQRPEADINIEFQANSKFAAQSQAMQPAEKGGMLSF